MLQREQGIISIIQSVPNAITFTEMMKNVLEVKVKRYDKN